MNKVALITGSSKGIGAAIAEKAAASDYDVVITYHTDEPGAQKTAAACINKGAQTLICQLESKEEASAQELFKKITDRFGRLDMLVINATDDIPKSVEEATLEEWHHVLLMKLDGAFLATKYAIPLLQKSDNPNIIILSSIDGELPDGTYLGYQVAEAGLTAMTKAWAVSLAPKYGIRVNALFPGPVKTDLWRKAGMTDDEIWQGFAHKNPMKRIPTTDDVANACLMLTEDPNRYLNGTVLFVDGGRHLLQ